MNLNTHHFDGKTYDPVLDGKRLGSQLKIVAFCLSNGHYWTLSALAGAANCSECSASARLRDLRKPRFGSYLIERKRFKDNLWMYRMVIPTLTEYATWQDKLQHEVINPGAASFAKAIEETVVAILHHEAYK
jgi:hypothetical protein